MIILDENVPVTQRELLRGWGIRARQVGPDIGRSGMTDQDILPMLRELTRPTFFTRDEDFRSREFCHPRYCLAWLSTRPNEVAEFVRRTLAHPSFCKARDRMGRLLQISHVGIRAWSLRDRAETHHLWLPK